MRRKNIETIGETSRLVKLKIWDIGGKNWFHGHRFYFERTRILNYEVNCTKRKIKKSQCIKKIELLC